MKVSHIIILVVAFAAGLIIAEKNPAAVTKYTGGLVSP